jgi:tetratricopeptide (TPR) repeat protein
MPKLATECYRKALEKKPPAGQLQVLRIELAQTLIDMIDYSGALEVLDAAQVDAPVLARQAECRWGLGDRDEALALLNKAIALNSEERGALLLKARIDLEDGRPQMALKPLQTLLDRDPHDFNTRYQLSTAYQALGEAETAAAELARMKASQALLDQLLKQYSEALQRPRDPVIRDEIADLCEKLNKPDLVKLWRRSAEYCRQISETSVLMPAEANP